MHIVHSLSHCVQGSPCLRDQRVSAEGDEQWRVGWGASKPSWDGVRTNVPAAEVDHCGKLPASGKYTQKRNGPKDAWILVCSKIWQILVCTELVVSWHRKRRHSVCVCCSPTHLFTGQAGHAVILAAYVQIYRKTFIIVAWHCPQNNVGPVISSFAKWRFSTCSVRSRWPHAGSRFVVVYMQKN